MSYILTIRSDKPEAEVGLYDMNGKQVSYHTWLAHRQLSATLLGVIRDELTKQGATFDDIGSVLVFRGPGSFTGLRIGITVANTIAHSLTIPIVGIADEHEWLGRGLAKLADGGNDQLVMPEYGAEAHITQQKK